MAEGGGHVEDVATDDEGARTCPGVRARSAPLQQLPVATRLSGEPEARSPRERRGARPAAACKTGRTADDRPRARDRELDLLRLADEHGANRPRAVERQHARRSAAHTRAAPAGESEMRTRQCMELHERATPEVQ